MKFNIHAGHNPDGKVACGAVGLVKESTEARKIVKLVVAKLKALGHTVYNCTVDDGKSQNDVLYKIVEKCNAHAVDYDISVHLNAGANDKKGNKKTTGVEVLIYNASSKAKAKATSVCDEIAKLGFKKRGVKTNSSLFFLRKSKSPSMLIECFFVDDKDDTTLYDAEKMANAIVKGLVGAVAPATTPVAAPTTPATPESTVSYIAGGVDYALVFDHKYYYTKYPDVKEIYGINKSKLLNHFINYGMKEGRQAKATFNVNVYKNNYSDLVKAFGNNLPKYYMHYITNGYKENRKAY